MARVGKILFAVLVVTSLGFSMADPGSTGKLPTRPSPGVSTSTATD